MRPWRDLAGATLCGAEARLAHLEPHPRAVTTPSLAAAALPSPPLPSRLLLRRLGSWSLSEKKKKMIRAEVAVACAASKGLRRARAGRAVVAPALG